MWTFPSLADPTIFIAAPGDLAYLREAAARELDALRHKVADDHGLKLYDWLIDKAEDGFRDWVPPQGQIPLPSDPNCRAVICLLGERIGTPLSEDFDTGPLGPLARYSGGGAQLIHPWPPGAEEDGGFALTGTVFEYLAALQANDTRGVREAGQGDAGLERGQPPVLLLVIGDETVREDLDPLDAHWGGQRLYASAEQRFQESHGARWRTAHRTWERDHYLPQVMQLRNLLRFLESRSIFPRVVADEEQAREQIRAFLTRELDLRVRESVRDPFKGLQVYDRDDNPVFVGRETERREAVAELTALWEDAHRPTFYGVIGGSGVGKSSLARAGIVGHLCHQTSKGNYLACIVRPDELLPDPMPRLYAFALAQIDPAVSFEQARASLAAVRDEHEAEEAVRRLGDALAARGRDWRLLLAFDQFEELLDRRTSAEDAPAWAPVVDFIVRATAHPAMGVVYTLQTNRAELIAQDPTLGPLWARGGNLRLAFPEHSLDEIIRKPFEIAGVAVLEPELVRSLRERIVRFAHRSDGESTGSLLPLVSLTLRRIFEARTNGIADAAAGSPSAGQPTATQTHAATPAQAENGNGAAAALPRLGLHDCEGLLDIEDAISELADAAVQEARALAGADWTDDAIGSLMRRLVRLSGASNDRLLLPDAPMPRNPAPRRLAQALLQRRLLLPEAGDRIKLVHEAVLRHWPAASRWLDSERRLLRLAGIVGYKAEEWDSGGRADAGLADHGEHDLNEAAELLAHWPDVLGSDVADSRPSPADLRIRDYALALLRQHPEPRRAVASLTTGPTHLYLAGIYGDLPLLQTLLTQDPEAVRVPRRDGRTALFAPCFTGKLPVLDRLLAAGSDPDHAETAGWRPLHVAASTGRVDVLERLIAAGASLALASDGQATPPLYLAAVNGHTRMVEALLARGADPAQVASDGWTALHAAAAEGHATVVAALATGGAPLEARLSEDGPTALHLAARHGRAEAVAALATAGAALDATHTHERRQHSTALHLAVHLGQPGSASALLSAGAQADLQDDFGHTALSLALDRGDFAMATTLLAGGAKVDAPAVNGDPCLHLAVAQDDETRTRFLLQQGAHPDAAGGQGRSALQIAAARGNAALVELLLAAGANPMHRDVDGACALHHAARFGRDAALARLLRAPEVRVDACDADGAQALHLAAEAGHAGSVALLLQHGTDPDSADADGWTALHLAALGGHPETVRTLLAAGASVHARSTLPETLPLGVAAELGHADVLRLLLDAGARVDEATAHKPRPLESALRFRQLDAARALLAAGASVAPEDRPWVDQLLGNAETPSDIPPPAATASPALRGLFNTRGPQAGGMPLGSGLGSNSSALEALAAAQARMHTAQAGVMDYQWRPAPQSLRAELANEPSLAAADLRIDGARSRIDVTGLAWYDEALLVRVQDPDWPNPALTAWFVRSADGALVRLLGRSTPLHDLADIEPLRLGPANVLGYLKFFCFFVRGEEGAFYVLEHADDPLIPAGIDPRLRVLLEETVRPASYEGRDEAGRHLCEAVVWYSNALFHARFALDDGGGIEMLSDEPVAGELPIRADAPLS